jgi:protein involved in polysaccharide export with SLBB domain
MRRLLIASAGLLLWATPALAQNALETQAPVPLGGTDTRSLPDRKQLPPMFGWNLFFGFEATAQPGTGVPTGARPGTGGASATGAGSAAGGAASATGANAASSTEASSTAGDAGATQSTMGASGQDAASLIAGAGAAGQQPTGIAATNVQPPPGMTAFDPNHVMAPGDAVQIHIYGATTLDQPATVDSNGEIFLPSIGPVHVGGTLAGNLQSVVAAAIAAVYQSNAQVYVTLARAVPINVFVTGAVNSPGQYAQPSTGSVITFLKAAGGIDPRRGSYRAIKVLRDGRPVADVDLYDFLLRGRLPSLRLRERDTILVQPQGATVAAEGAVSGVFRYELTRPQTGAQLTALARPYPDATRVNLVGIRGGRPATVSYSLKEFDRVPIEDGDVVTFTPDTPTDVMTVKFEGRIDGPTGFVVTRQATLYDVLPYIPIDPYFSDISSIYVRRVSVAQAQEKSIKDAMQRLKAAVVTSPTITTAQAQMQQQQAQVIFQFASQLSNVKPEGRLIVEHGGKLENVRLEDGDVIVVPSRTDLVLVSGEVRVPQAMVWVSGANIEHYIKTAGGFTDRADDSELLVIRASGETIVGSDPPVSPGDRVIVLPAASNWTLPFITDLTQILYQVAVTTGVALTLKP